MYFFTKNPNIEKNHFFFWGGGRGGGWGKGARVSECFFFTNNPNLKLK